MKSSYVVDLVASPDVVWESLTDLDTVVVRLPGAALERDGDAVTGSVKTRLGGAQITYRVTARADIGVSGRHVAVIVVTGREARGQGALAASLTVTVRPSAEAGRATVEVHSDIEVTGRAEAADEDSWATVLGALLTGVLPFEAIAPAPPTAAEPAPRLESYADVASRPAPGLDRRMIFALAGIVVLLVAWRRKRRK